MGRISAEVSFLRSLNKLRKSGLESSNLPLRMVAGWECTALENCFCSREDRGGFPFSASVDIDVS